MDLLVRLELQDQPPPTLPRPVRRHLPPPRPPPPTPAASFFRPRFGLSSAAASSASVSASAVFFLAAFSPLWARALASAAASRAARSFSFCSALFTSSRNAVSPASPRRWPI